MCDTTIINMLQRWRILLINHKDAYYKASQQYAYRSSWLKFLIVVSTSISTALSIGGISNQDVSRILLYVIACFNAANILFTTLESKTQWSTLSSKYKVQSTGYLKIILLIERQLTLQNLNPETIINDIIKSYQNLEETDLILPPGFLIDQKEELIDCAINYRKSVRDIEVGDIMSPESHVSL